MSRCTILQQNCIAHGRISTCSVFFARHDGKYKIAVPRIGEIYVPEIAFNFVHLLTHAYRHMFGDGIGLRQIMDLHFASRQLRECSGAKDLSEIKNVVRKAGMERFASAMMWVLYRVFTATDSAQSQTSNEMLWVPNQKDGQFLLDEILLSGNFGHYDERFCRKGESHGHRFWRVTKQNWRLLRFSPWEVLCAPLWRIWHFVWMRRRGFTQG